jgi:hypothetical protein
MANATPLDVLSCEQVGEDVLIIARAHKAVES